MMRYFAKLTWLRVDSFSVMTLMGAIEYNLVVHVV